MRLTDSYIKEKRLELSSSIQDRKIIYLDLKFWIILREQSKQKESVNKLLFDKVTELSESRKCIFPISETTFWEILKQGDFKKLKDTINLVDKLSEGVSMINEQERIRLEFLHFVRKCRGEQVHDLKELVWSQITPALFNWHFPCIKPFLLQKSFFDFIITLPLSIILPLIENDQSYTPFDFKDNIDALNEYKSKYSNENRTYKEMFLSELWGLLDLYKQVFNEIMLELFYKETGRVPTEDDKKGIDELSWVKLIYGGFKHGKLKDELPIFRINADLHAAIRWNKERKYKDGNDTMDFMHASYALPYCDYFFTENELCALVKERKLDELYGCIVESKLDKILEILSSIE